MWGSLLYLDESVPVLGIAVCRSQARGINSVEAHSKSAEVLSATFLSYSNHAVQEYGRGVETAIAG